MYALAMTEAREWRFQEALSEGRAEDSANMVTVTLLLPPQTSHLEAAIVGLNAPAFAAAIPVGFILPDTRIYRIVTATMIMLVVGVLWTTVALRFTSGTPRKFPPASVMRRVATSGPALATMTLFLGLVFLAGTLAAASLSDPSLIIWVGWIIWSVVGLVFAMKHRHDYELSA
jgi:hypothetical protein